MEKLERCHLFGGQPYIAKKDGKYHVLQGSMTDDDVQKWYDTEDEAVKRWNSRVKSAYGYEKLKMGITRDVQAEYEHMKNIIVED